MMPESINFERDTDSQVSSSTPALSIIAVDMSMTKTQKDDELDSIKNMSNDRCSALKEPESWWKEIRGTVVKQVTDQRNNCIKSMSTKYKCKYSIQIQKH
jgi:hypothetical protein